MTLYYEKAGIAIYHGDCRDIAPGLVPADVVIADPPYGVTSLTWDQTIDGWLEALNSRCLWCFGSMRFFMQQEFPGWQYGQEIIWEKHNGSNMHNDRFRRVHEIAVQFYRGVWSDLWKQTVTTPDAVKKTVRRKANPPHMRPIDGATYSSEDGGPRMMRSVIQVRSCHGYAQHPTQKPIEIIVPLVQYSCPPGGLVLDPTAGSCTTAIAAYQSGRKCVCIELQEKYCEIGAKRIEAEISQGRLFHQQQEKTAETQQSLL